MRDISKWFEARSTEQDSAGIRQHLSKLIGRLTGTSAALRGDRAPPVDAEAVGRSAAVDDVGDGAEVPTPEGPDDVPGA